MPTTLPGLLYEARRALHVGSQGEFGRLLGSSTRSGQRWETGRASPSYDQLLKLVALVYPRNPQLAAQLATHLGRDLVSLGIAAPPAPPPPPPLPPPPTEDVVDAIVCAAAEAIDLTPRQVRPAVMAAFARARRLGLAVEAVEKALAKAGTAAKAAP